MVDGSHDIGMGESGSVAVHSLGARTAAAAEPTLFPDLEETIPLRSLVDVDLAPLHPEDAARHLAAAGATAPKGMRSRVPGFVVDLIALTTAAAASAVAEGVHAHAAGLPAFSGATDTFVRLLPVVPVLAAVTAATSRSARFLLRASFVGRVCDVVAPLFAGGLASLMAWRLLEGIAGLPRAPLDAVLLTSAVGVFTVGAARSLHGAPQRRQGRRARRVVVVGSGVVADRMRTQLESQDVHVVGFVDDDPADDAGCLGPLAALSEVIAREEIDHVVVAFSRTRPEVMINFLRPLQGRLPITVVPRLFDVVPMSAAVQELTDGFPGVSVTPGGVDPWHAAVKRTGDMVGACMALLLLSPLVAAAAVAVRLSSPGPVILRQARVGRDGKVFSMFKFRTMLVQAPAERGSGSEGTAVIGPFPKLKDDPRITPAGRVLRRLSVDELPQLVNVVRGDMSLVGPRPFVVEDAQSIGGWALRRYSVRPGITGLWQVSGRNDLTYDEMCRLDDLYVTGWSLGLDFKVLVRTLRAVSAGRGAY